MRILILIVFGTLSTSVFGQKLVKKMLVNPESRTILIDADKCFQVDLKTANGNEILVNATIDGEYRKDLVVSIEEEGTNVLISADFQPNFLNPNDKLSAHKVLSISLDITLPKSINTHVFGTNTNVSASGTYEKLKVDLADGNCTLDNVGQRVEAKTQSGSIFLNTSGGTVRATSQYGQVFKEQIPSGDNFFKLQSVEGDIHILKTE